MVDSVDNSAGKILKTAVKHGNGDTVGRSEPAQSSNFCPVLFLSWQKAFPTKAGRTALTCCQQPEKRRQGKLGKCGD